MSSVVLKLGDQMLPCMRRAGFVAVATACRSASVFSLPASQLASSRRLKKREVEAVDVRRREQADSWLYLMRGIEYKICNSPSDFIAPIYVANGKFVDMIGPCQMSLNLFS